MPANDNLPALRLYQRHGFALAGVRPGEIERTRRRKPQISATGHAGIPIRDELILERDLDSVRSHHDGAIMALP